MNFIFPLSAAAAAAGRNTKHNTAQRMVNRFRVFTTLEDFEDLKFGNLEIDWDAWI